MSTMAESAPPHGVSPNRQLAASALEDSYRRYADTVDAPERALAAHLDLGRQRHEAEVLTRVYRPGDRWDIGAALQIITDDMPLLVESVIALLTRLGVAIRELVHPVVSVRRDEDGGLREMVADTTPPSGFVTESWIHVQLHPATAEAALDAVGTEIGGVLADVRQVGADTAEMLVRERDLATELDALAENPPPRRAAEDLRETAALLRWFARGNYTVLGYRRYDVVADASGTRHARAVPGSGLGVLRSDLAADDVIDMSATVEAADRPLLVLTQASLPATVHRSVYPYFVGVAVLDSDGRVVGEHRFLGVLAVTALHENVLDIPVLARRVREVVARAGVELSSFTGQAMLEVLQALPRVELFSADTETLHETVTAVVAMRRQLRLFVRVDPYGRFVSCLIYLPRDRYNTRVRVAMQQILLREYGGGAIHYTARVTEGDLALLHVTIRTPPGQALPRIDTSEDNRLRIQALLAEASRSWDDHLADLAATDHTVDPVLVQRYAEVLPDGYKEDFDADRALADIARLEALRDGSIDLLLYRRPGADPRRWRFTLYIGSEGITLSQVLPVLQSLGVEVLDERPYQIIRADRMSCWIYDFGLVLPVDLEPDPKVTTRFTAAFAAVWHGLSEPDRFNELVLRAGMGWRQAMMLRAYAKYLRQAGFPYSQYHIEGVLLADPATTALLAELFEAMFDPAEASADREQDTTAELAGRIDAVVGLDADRILRGLFGLIRATLRTNYFVSGDDGAVPPARADAAPARALSFKLDPTRIDELPQPRPKFEVFVYAPDVEGVHMRFGAVARGGLRWSDRREDFRTEILGLAKAQAVKNAVIVPVGAKGGFVVKRPVSPTGDAAADRQAVRAQGEACYRRFIAGLLDVTDNLDRARGVAVPPPRVVRRDGDDTYLVVAADKGTATFSDLANEVAREYGFWLGDAFASGGSAGYDHKAMGITARGAWESVKRHFRELGVDTQSEDFTVAGIGDMSGDVFGNGMLLSTHIRLVAAFDHRHIFLDPDPEPAASYAERRRLYELPRSSWADYDTDLISTGGGVWERSLKSVPLSAEVRSVLGLDNDVTELSPPELIRAILRAPVDLLWNGGIGTYVKAAPETDADVGDKSNDAVRVNGGTLRARVVGEGGNLGVTQRGRIEYARAGGKINTDAIDNSAGVDCSDHEVNIKILLDSMVTAGALAAADRNPLLESMTDEVGRIVLEDNISQNNLLGYSRTGAPTMLAVHQRLIADLVAERGIDRSLEALPGDAEIERRRLEGEGLTSPELSTLLAHVKLALADDLLDTDLPDSETFAGRLPGYFPRQLREPFRAGIRSHPLRRQIVATILANETVDNGGISYVYRLSEEAGASSTDAIRAYAAVTEIFDLPGVWARIRSADTTTAVADDLLLESHRVLDRASRWLLSNRPQPLAVGAEISRYRAMFARLAPRVGEWMQGHHVQDLKERAEPLLARGAPEELTWDVFRLLDQFPLLDVIDIADIAERDEAEVAELYYAMDAHMGIDWLLSAVTSLERGDRWHSLARLALRDELYGSLRTLTLDVLATAEPGESTREMIEDWELTNGSRLGRARSALEEIFLSGNLDLATLSVAARQVRSMVRAGAPDRR
ncbi:NAD-glutamate dehydrogenase [Rhodococcus ruber]|nr:NAD-glutamate dehydrogenase [Rhodococcus ruber]MBD8056176.1 NAD-glutamate dehydrogenase [Rhodococcus ruber]MCF8783373.1 NAD-glutamate dehydrogenase [Rhodococcus ruber]